MKSVLFAAIAAMSITSVAHATDLPSKKHAPVAPVAAKAVPANWTGAYIGAFGGYGWGSSDFHAGTVDADLGSIDTISGTSQADGGLFGAQIGYDLDLGNNLVIGAVGDIAKLNGKGGEVCVDANGNCTDNPPPWAYSYGKAEINWLSTVRARLGYSMGDALLYVTGGVAYADTKASISNFAGSNTWTASRGDWGWALGAGVEYKVTKNISLGAEYLHVDLGSNDYTFKGLQGNDSTSGSAVTKLGLTDDIVKVSLNYRF